MLGKLLQLLFCNLIAFISFAKQNDIASLLIGTWKLDSVGDYNPNTLKNRIRHFPNYSITFEASGRMRILQESISATEKSAAPAAVFKSASWKVFNDDTLVSVTTFRYGKGYRKKANVKKAKFTVIDKSKIIRIDQSFLYLKSYSASNPYSISTTYYSRVQM